MFFESFMIDTHRCVLSNGIRVGYMACRCVQSKNENKEGMRVPTCNLDQPKGVNTWDRTHLRWARPNGMTTEQLQITAFMRSFFSPEPIAAERRLARVETGGLRTIVVAT